MCDAVHDDHEALLFATCHPVLSTEARVALTLRLFGGMTTAEIASAFLVRLAYAAAGTGCANRFRKRVSSRRGPLIVSASERTA